MLGRNLIASVEVAIGSVARSAGHACVVERVAILATRHATPAALILRRRLTNKSKIDFL
jgi:hypothetical protein